MRQIGWFAFQLLIMGWMISIYANDPNPAVRDQGGAAVLAAFFISGIATVAVAWTVDLFRRFHAWGQRPPEIGLRTLTVRFLARRRDRRLHRLRSEKSADHVRLSHPAARTGGDLPKQIT